MFFSLHDSLVSVFLHWHFFFFFVNFPLFHVYLVCVSVNLDTSVWLFKHDQTLEVCNITFILMSGL